MHIKKAYLLTIPGTSPNTIGAKSHLDPTTACLLYTDPHNMPLQYGNPALNLGVKWTRPGCGIHTPTWGNARLVVRRLRELGGGRGKGGNRTWKNSTSG